MKQGKRLDLIVMPEHADKIRAFLQETKEKTGVSIQRIVTNILLGAIESKKFF